MACEACELHRTGPVSARTALPAASHAQCWTVPAAAPPAPCSCMPCCRSSAPAPAWLSAPTRPCTLLQLHLGVDARARGFKLEQLAVNDATFRVPDQRGWQPTGQLIDDRPGCTLNTHLKTDLDVGQLAGGACMGAEASTVEEGSWLRSGCQLWAAPVVSTTVQAR